MSRIMQKEIKSEMNDFFFAKDHLDFYHEYVNVEQKYLAGIKEVRTKLEILDDEFHHRFDHNPIHHMEWRLKSPHSVVEKMKRRNLPVEVSSIKGNIEDIAGIRVICHYIKDIYRMSDLLLRQDDIHLLKIKDYIKNPKENGYRSLHLVVEVPVYLANEKVMVPVEIQIRTIAMDFWATLEHHLRYKNDKEISDDIRNRLSDCAKSITINGNAKSNNSHNFNPINAIHKKYPKLMLPITSISFSFISIFLISQKFLIIAAAIIAPI